MAALAGLLAGLLEMAPLQGMAALAGLLELAALAPLQGMADLGRERTDGRRGWKNHTGRVMIFSTAHPLHAPRAGR